MNSGSFQLAVMFHGFPGGETGYIVSLNFHGDGGYAKYLTRDGRWIQPLVPGPAVHEPLELIEHAHASRKDAIDVLSQVIMNIESEVSPEDTG